MALLTARRSALGSHLVLRTSRWRGRSDMALAMAFVSSAVALGVAPLPASERVIPFAALAAVVLGWARALREQWEIDGPFLRHRGWWANRSIDVTMDTHVIVERDDHGPDSIVFADPNGRIEIRCVDLLAAPDFAGALAGLAARGSATTEVFDVLR